MLPLLGSHDYLQNAGDNAVADGGEVFRAARRVIESSLGLEISPRFPDAHAIVAIAKMYLEENASGELQLRDVDGFSPIALKTAAVSDFQGGPNEMRVARIIGPGDIQLMPLEKFLKTTLKPVSAAAEIKLENLRTRGTRSSIL
jgi:hypothetical protein